MRDKKKKYIVLEIGKSAYTEFKSKSGKFYESDDAIVVDTIYAASEQDACAKIIASESDEDREFDDLVAHELK